MPDLKDLPSPTNTSLVRVKKNYTPLAQSNIINTKVTVGNLLDAHRKIIDLGGSSAADGAELAGPWYIYKELTADIGATISEDQIKVLVEAGAINREVSLSELVKVGQDFSGPSLAAGGELVGPWFVLKEGKNAIETVGDITKM
ncbi:hypothetical protein [Gilvimarinus agarilyticus]|uniref:hypothetical protein n=1 Tax=Gilvimarinus agarilyticus TaxID=679259 RepID=UPI0005A3022D|nr:hypothetical protein [Gilvimarinus agarilyticus]